MSTEPILSWLRKVCAAYRVDIVAALKIPGKGPWPITAQNDEDLVRELNSRGHLAPLPKEPAALANIIEVSVVDHILRAASELDGVLTQRGTERGYPDLEISGGSFGSKHFAVDIKVARRNKNQRSTQSRITLYTGNSYFMYPSLHWPGTFRPFQDYAAHIDVIALYNLDSSFHGRVREVELIVHESWRIGSKQRSSTTREYLGAVQSIQALRDGIGDFKSEEEFLRYWRKHPFKIGKAVEIQLKKLLRKPKPPKK